MIIIGSVSGKSQNVIDLAIEAKKFGLTVVALTSVEYSKSVESLHKSGKRLFECADFVIDNCAPAAEAMLEIEGVDVRLQPLPAFRQPSHCGASAHRRLKA